MKKMIYIFIIIIILNCCFVKVFAYDTLDIYRLGEYDFDLLLYNQCNFNMLSGITMDSYKLGEAVSINGSAIMTDALIEDVYSENLIMQAISNYDSQLVINEYKIFTVNTRYVYSLPHLIWLDTSNGYYIAVGSLNDDYNYTYSVLTPDKAKEEFLEKKATVCVNDESIYMDYAIIRYHGAMLSLRSIAENMGLIVEWDDSENAVIISSDEKMLKIVIEKGDKMNAYDLYNNEKYFINGSNLVIEPCIWKDDRIVVDSSQLNSIFKFFYGGNFKIKVDGADGIVNIINM